MQEFKAKAKTTQKMTRDGVVETNQATGEQTRKSQRETDDFSGDTAENMTGKALNRAATERQRHKAKKRRKKANKAAQKAQEATGKQTTRLQFKEEERTDPELAKYVKKSEKAADRLEAAREKIPKQKRIKAAREFDEATGRAKTRLYFEKTDKPPNGKLHHNPADRPIREIKNYVHGKVGEVEKENSGVEGAHKTEKLAEKAGGYAGRKLKEGYRSHKLKPYRAAAKAEAASMKADTNYLYHKTLKENPELAGNPLSRFHQKQQIKRQYAKDLRAAQKAGKTAGKTAGAAKNTRKAAQKTGESHEKDNRLYRPPLERHTDRGRVPALNRDDIYRAIFLRRNHTGRRFLNRWHFLHRRGRSNPGSGSRLQGTGKGLAGGNRRHRNGLPGL